MGKVNRREFMKMLGAGSGAVTAGAVLPTTGILRWTDKDVFIFRAVTGLPMRGLPSYASYVIQGSVNLSTRSGIVTKSVYAGPPEARSTIALPGLSRIVRVTDVRELGGELHVAGEVEDRLQLRQGESSTVEVKIDRARGVAQALFLGTDVLLQLES